MREENEIDRRRVEVFHDVHQKAKEKVSQVNERLQVTMKANFEAIESVKKVERELLASRKELVHAQIELRRAETKYVGGSILGKRSLTVREGQPNQE